jgi:hypothetical protein
MQASIQLGPGRVLDPKNTMIGYCQEPAEAVTPISYPNDGDAARQ